jgi:CRISPR-associated protein Csx10
LESPLVIRRDRQSPRSEGVQFINGTLLRGAFAQAYLQQTGRTNATFHRLFLDATFHRLFLDEEACRFGPLAPADRVFPLTALSCKRQPGFLEDGKHGVVDRLASLLGRRFGQSPPPLERCGKCGEALKAHSGFWSLTPEGRPTEPKRLWRRTVAVHVGIDRHTHTAAESVLFNLPVLEPQVSPTGQAPVLHGWIEADEDTREILQRLLQQEEHILRIGHARTRGYGRVHVTIGEEMPAPAVDFEAFSRQILERVAPPLRERGGYFLFTLSLPTGAILVDQLLRYTLDPAGMVPWLPPLPSPDPAVGVFDTPSREFAGGRLWCVTAVAQHERLRGWNAAHGLPRQDEWMVSRGSVYAYLYEGDPGGQEALQAKLRELQASGLGARRNEGFGQVVICDDFHLRFSASNQP